MRLDIDEVFWVVVLVVLSIGRGVSGEMFSDRGFVDCFSLR
ncbi:hypothetical protein [Bartonella senegalensis]|nr:hypothetical protein [Bartonella senegalensis]